MRRTIARESRSHGAVLLCFGLLGVFASPAAAGTVTLGSDSTLTFDAMCLCFVPSVPGELRTEIYDADPGDTVEIAPGVNVTLSQGQILVDKNLTIEGQGADATAIFVSASSSRIFKIGSFTPAAVVTIRDLSMVAGKASNGTPGTSDAGESGGAIRTSADLTLDRVDFFLNRAGDGGSGADGANGNPGDPGDPGGPGGFGGAVSNTVGGDLTVTDSTFHDNSAGDGGPGGQGGDCVGCMIVGFAGNGGTGGVGHDGGAISNAGVLTVTNSTFVGNESGQGGTGGDVGNIGFGVGGAGGAGGDGGAIHQAGAGSLTLTNTTIASNVASAGGLGGMGFVSPAASGAGGAGGGTFIFNTVTPTIANTLYSLNTAVSGSNCAGGGPITSQGANLSFPAGGCPGSFSSGDPQLAALADNSGPTLTMALGAGSAAINQVAVGSPNCPGADQRGVARPQGPTCDIGAFELEVAPVPPTPPGGTTNPGTNPSKKKCKKKGPKRKKKAKKCGKKKKKKRR